MAPRSVNFQSTFQIKEVFAKGNYCDFTLGAVCMQVPPNSVARDVSAALAWLLHCQRYGIEEYVDECELEFAQHYLELAKDRAQDLAALSGSCLVRISQAYARCAWATSHNLAIQSCPEESCPHGHAHRSYCGSCSISRPKEIKAKGSFIQTILKARQAAATGAAAVAIDGKVAPQLRTFMGQRC